MQRYMCSDERKSSILLGMKFVLGTNPNNPCKTEGVTCGFSPPGTSFLSLAFFPYLANLVKRSGLFLIFFKLLNQENSFFFFFFGGNKVCLIIWSRKAIC